MQRALDSIPLKDEAYRQRLRPYVQRYAAYADSLARQNPYGVPIGLGNWAGSGQVLGFGTTVCLARRTSGE